MALPSATRCLWPPLSACGRRSNKSSISNSRGGFFHLLTDFDFCYAAQAQRKGEVFKYGQMRIKRVVLKYEGNITLARG